VARAVWGRPCQPIDKEALKQQIREAFATVQYPGDWCLRGSNEGDEPYLVEQEFRGKTDWQSLEPKFIDRAHGGEASALSFFSDETFRFYRPAYLQADIDHKLEQANPLFHLTHGFDDESRNKRVNPRRYGERTWYDEARHKFAMFLPAEVAAIVAYLRYKLADECVGEDDKQSIQQTLWNY